MAKFVTFLHLDKFVYFPTWRLCFVILSAVFSAYFIYFLVFSLQHSLAKNSCGLLFVTLGLTLRGTFYCAGPKGAGMSQ